ncbi:uncharacterized protein LOC105700607 [Orussus abietinus]|uniref:uncharacterized protein LOC105700607 n=1 Tax=Orussus abietinus TaxID=222816 RepID=UPI000625616B|nr:uncharacterized protein LOC105700607 [Orussus abietinus]
MRGRVLAACLLGLALARAGSPRLPRTSADQRGVRNANLAGGNLTVSSSGPAPGSTSAGAPSGLLALAPPPSPSRGSQRNREQYLFNVFEVIVSTLESKLQRIENLDKAVEHLMRRVEALDSRVNDNIEKTDAVIAKLKSLDLKLFHGPRAAVESGETSAEAAGRIRAQVAAPGLPDRQPGLSLRSTPGVDEPSAESLGEKLHSLDRKVSDIDDKLVDLKNQLDNNFLPNDDINAEASEKRPVSASAIDAAKTIGNEVMNHVSIEIENLRQATGNMDRKLQFHMNLVSENLGAVYAMLRDVHNAVVDREAAANFSTSTLGPRPSRASKIDRLAESMHPMLTVSEKMDQVWNVVVGTKSSVDDLVPKSDELLTQTQRQERAISEIHADLRSKTNKIIENLEGVESRLRKQDDVAMLAQRPVPAELLLDPTIDRLVEYDPTRYVGSLEDLAMETAPPTGVGPPGTSTVPPGTVPATPSGAATPSNATQTPPTSTPTPTSTPSPTPTPTSTSSGQRSSPRNRGVIFPSVKNKPSPANSTFTTDLLINYKDIKGYSCVDLLNAGMRESGVYYLQIRGTTYWFLKVYCEQDIAEGGWTVIQRRDDFGEPRENFNRDWADYKNGFGDPAREFWLGNENIYMLTNNEDYVLRVELEDFEGNKRFAQYSHFKIYSEGEYYKLEIDGYEGNAGDSLNDPWYGSNNSPFSTYNRDNDRSSLNCASMLKGGWWWKSCGRGLNGLYLNDPQDLTARQGIVWFRWRGWDYTLKKATMMIKPKGPTPTV